ncbi:hypothetical protein [Methylobacterium nodulans]|uniref:Uncharacterized protein n=1 Tax=Methylobacterium nodulans (strain LMG 21967 / CNCM I-2342 / ORS 2060) TaxID=460265 RepID=B8IJ38_METNO|nr:hypothetical protein [Methylobacterium nodulans]ACL61833.1 conserved hypothetical protein [Methylobacterium nodulans ORS 2060]
MILKPLLAAGALILAAAPAFAQGGSPYNASGAQAGGPRAGLERRYGAWYDERVNPSAVYPRERAPIIVAPRSQPIPGFFVED